MPIDPSKPVTELRYPEFYDIGINTRCYGGCHKYCYTSAVSNGVNFPNVESHIETFFGNMTPNQRPFQVAIGASGEATLHERFKEVLRLFHDLGIVPNYTTNAMHMTDEVMEATSRYCGGVAITLHRHLEKHWRDGIAKLKQANIRTNVHIIVSDEQSIKWATDIYSEFCSDIEYFVLLPYMNVGFAANHPKTIDYTGLGSWLDKVADEGKIAFGSGFYEWLKTHRKYDVSIYEPEICSKYLLLSDPIKIMNNSFECSERKFDPIEGVELRTKPNNQ